MGQDQPGLSGVRREQRRSGSVYNGGYANAKEALAVLVFSVPAIFLSLGSEKGLLYS